MNIIAFIKSLNYYSDWVSAAKTQGPQEYRDRIEAILLWLSEQIRLVPADYRPMFEHSAEAYRRATDSLPPPKQKLRLPDIQLAPDVSMRQKGMTEVLFWRALTARFPAETASDLLYCLDATQKNRVPDSEVDFDHLLVFLLKGLIIAFTPRNDAALIQLIPNFALWIEHTPVNRGFNKDELSFRLLRLLGIDPGSMPSNSDNDRGGKPPPTKTERAKHILQEAKRHWNWIDYSMKIGGFGPISGQLRGFLDDLERISIL